VTRRTRLKSKRATPRRSSRVRDEAWLAEVRRLPCCAPFAYPLAMVDPWTPCRGRVEADHAGARPLGRKASDDTAIPLCQRHHRERTDYSGHFKGWDAARMREWCDWKIAETQTTVTAHLAGIGGAPGVPW
jgi:hypothetical protein